MTVMCICGERYNPEDFACSVCSTDSITITGKGSETQPLSATPRLDESSENIMTCEADGLLVQLPVYLTNPPRCQVYHDANQSLPDDDTTVLAFNQERYDWSVTAMHDTATLNSRITFPIDGIYICTLVVTIAANATGDRAAYIRKNGRETLGGSEKKAASASFATDLTVVIQEEFLAGEYIEGLAKQDSGGALNAQVQTWAPIMSATFRRISP